MHQSHDSSHHEIDSSLSLLFLHMRLMCVHLGTEKGLSDLKGLKRVLGQNMCCLIALVMLGLGLWVSSARQGVLPMVAAEADLFFFFCITIRYSDWVFFLIIVHIHLCNNNDIASYMS